jgi:hypothetical protein
MTVDEFKKMLAELNHQVVNFKVIEEKRKAETSTRSVPSKLMENKNRLRGRYNDSNMGRYK